MAAMNGGRMYGSVGNAVATYQKVTALISTYSDSVKCLILS